MHSANQMEHNLSLVRSNEKDLHLKELKINSDETKMIFQMIPEEVIYKILFFCGIVEKYALRFVCKQLHIFAHKCSFKQNLFFFADKITNEISIFTIAARFGYLDILKWMNQCFPIDFNLNNKFYCSSAAINGHLEVLKWLRDIGCPLDNKTCTFAASRGHLKVLKWARENGCP
jgi:hypothetical protein